MGVKSIKDTTEIAAKTAGFTLLGLFGAYVIQKVGVLTLRVSRLDNVVRVIAESTDEGLQRLADDVHSDMQQITEIVAMHVDLNEGGHNE